MKMQIFEPCCHHIDKGDLDSSLRKVVPLSSVGLSAGKEASFTSRIACSSGKDNQECAGYFRIDARKLLEGTEIGS